MLHRFAAALAGALLLQLSLLTSGTLCNMHRNHVPAMHSMAMAHDAARAAASAGMPTVGEPGAGMPTGQCDMPGGSKPCGAPWAPGACSSIASCVSPSPAIASLGTAAAVPTGHARTFAVAAAMPRGPSFAPELPPPRA